MKPAPKRYPHNNNNNNNRGHKHPRPQGRYNNQNQNQGRSTSAQRNHLQQQLDKHTNLARDAQTQGDKILAESHYQYAEHFLRMLNIIKADDARIAEREQAEKDARDARDAAATAARELREAQALEAQALKDTQTREPLDVTPSEPTVHPIETDVAADEDTPREESPREESTLPPKKAPIRRRRKVSDENAGEQVISNVTPLKRASVKAASVEVEHSDNVGETLEG